MRTSAILPCIFLVACASSSTEAPSYSSIRERLAAGPTRLLFGAQPEIGTLEARRWSSTDGWVTGSAPVGLDSGELFAQLDEHGQLVVHQLGLAVDPIDLPDALVGQPLQLRDVRVDLESAPPADVAWASDDAATAELPITLLLSWSIAFDGTVTPLGNDHLAPIPMTLALGGDADHVAATLGLHAQGILWSWAELLELTRLDLTMSGASVD